MSCYEWERGSIKLPTKEARRVREAVKAAAVQHRDKLYDHAQRFWSELPRSYKEDREKYRKACEAFLRGNVHDRFNNQGPDPHLPAWTAVRDEALLDDLTWLLQWRIDRKEGTPSRVQQSDLDPLIGKLTGTKPHMKCDEAVIKFDGRVVHWIVPENNHACERCRAHPVAMALFRTLASVAWTRGSGGTIVGNDEYNRDSTDEGGGSNFVKDTFGPERKSSRFPRTWR